MGRFSVSRCGTVPLLLPLVLLALVVVRSDASAYLSLQSVLPYSQTGELGNIHVDEPAGLLWLASSFSLDLYNITSNALLTTFDLSSNPEGMCSQWYDSQKLLITVDYGINFINVSDPLNASSTVLDLSDYFPDTAMLSITCDPGRDLIFVVDAVSPYLLVVDIDSRSVVTGFTFAEDSQVQLPLLMTAPRLRYDTARQVLWIAQYRCILNSGHTTPIWQINTTSLAGMRVLTVTEMAVAFCVESSFLDTTTGLFWPSSWDSAIGIFSDGTWNDQAYLPLRRGIVREALYDARRKQAILPSIGLGLMRVCMGSFPPTIAEYVDLPFTQPTTFEYTQIRSFLIQPQATGTQGTLYILASGINGYQNTSILELSVFTVGSGSDCPQTQADLPNTYTSTDTLPPASSFLQPVGSPNGTLLPDEIEEMRDIFVDTQGGWVFVLGSSALYRMTLDNPSVIKDRVTGIATLEQPYKMVTDFYEPLGVLIINSERDVYVVTATQQSNLSIAFTYHLLADHFAANSSLGIPCADSPRRLLFFVSDRTNTLVPVHVSAGGALTVNPAEIFAFTSPDPALRGPSFLACDNVGGRVWVTSFLSSRTSDIWQIDVGILGAFETLSVTSFGGSQDIMGATVDPESHGLVALGWMSGEGFYLEPNSARFSSLGYLPLPYTPAAFAVDWQRRQLFTTSGLASADYPLVLRSCIGSVPSRVREIVQLPGVPQAEAVQDPAGAYYDASARRLYVVESFTATYAPYSFSGVLYTFDVTGGDCPSVVSAAAPRLLDATCLLSVIAMFWGIVAGTSIWH